MSHIPLTPQLVLGAGIVFIPLSTLALALRLFQRRRQKAELGADDIFNIIAYVAVMAMQVTMIAESAKHEIGYPDPNKLPPGVPDASTNLPFYPIMVESVLAIGLIKLSLVFFLRRIFYHAGPPWFRWLSTALVVAVSIWTVAFFFVWIGFCKPNPSAYWASAAIEKKQCAKTPEIHRAIAISDAILDVPIIVMSIPILWRLQMSPQRKVAAMAVFLIGLVTVAASLTRMVVLIEVTAVRYDPEFDFEHIVTEAIYWTMIEVGLGYLVSNLLVIRGVVTVLSQRSLTSLRYLLSSTLRPSGRSQESTASTQWPPATENFRTNIESVERSKLNSKASTDSTDRGIHATTTVLQSEEVV